jgi:hypothetical protein
VLGAALGGAGVRLLLLRDGHGRKCTVAGHPGPAGPSRSAAWFRDRHRVVEELEEQPPERERLLERCEMTGPWMTTGPPDPVSRAIACAPAWKSGMSCSPTATNVGIGSGGNVAPSGSSASGSLPRPTGPRRHAAASSPPARGTRAVRPRASRHRRPPPPPPRCHPARGRPPRPATPLRAPGRARPQGPEPRRARARTPGRAP